MQQYELVLPNRTEVFFKNLEENKVLRRKKDNDLARPKVSHQRRDISTLLQNYLRVPGGLVTPKGNNIQWFYQKREHKKRNQAFCGMAQEDGLRHCSSMTVPSPAQLDSAAPHSPTQSRKNSSCQGRNLHQLPSVHVLGTYLGPSLTYPASGVLAEWMVFSGAFNSVRCVCGCFN